MRKLRVVGEVALESPSQVMAELELEASSLYFSQWCFYPRISPVLKIYYLDTVLQSIEHLV